MESILTDPHLHGLALLVGALYLLRQGAEHGGWLVRWLRRLRR